MRILGILLIVLGVLAFLYQGFTYVTRETVLEVGAVRATVDRERTVPIPPIVGGAAVVAGTALLLLGRRAEA